MNVGNGKRSTDSRRDQRGMAVIVVITVLSIIFLYVMANARTLYYLKRDLRIVEQQQTNRWQKIGGTLISNETGVEWRGEASAR